MKTHVTTEPYRANKIHPALCGARGMVGVVGPNKFKRLPKGEACKKCQKALKSVQDSKE